MFNSAGAPQFSKAVYDEIHRVVHRGTLLSAVLQTLVIVALFCIWLIAPKSQSSIDNTNLVPWVFGIYFIFLGLKIFWIKTHQMNDALTTLYTLFDVAALVGLIACFHIQYNVPPTASLNSATFGLLVFNISLRCFTFQAKWVLFATVITVIGWSSLVLYAFYHPDTVVTRDWTEYVLQGKMLVGAEVEKILTIILTGSTLALAVKGASKVLVSSVAATQAQASLSLFFSPRVSEMISQGKIEIKPGRGQKRIAAVIFIDLRGFTKMASAMEPDAVLGVLTEYHKRVVPIIDRNKGTVDKFMGDGILAHFGAAYESSTHALECLKAIEEICIEIQSWNIQRAKMEQDPIEVNLSASVGQLIFGATGDEGRLEMTVIGAPVNTAAKLEKQNKIVGSCVVFPRKLLTAAKDQGYQPKLVYETALAQNVVGLDEKIDIHFVPRDFLFKAA